MSRLSAAQRGQIARFLRIGILAAAGALVASGGHVAPSAIVGAVAGAIETAYRQANPAVPLRLIDPKPAPPATAPPAPPAT
jgi:hypothetical protein